MTARESSILKAINALQLPGKLARLFPLRLWRNSKGGAWQGISAIGERVVRPITRQNLERHRACLRPGDICLRGSRFNQFGLIAPGSSDVVGYTAVEITPAMVGHTVAIFTAIEAKAPGGRVDPKQRRFVQHIAQAGGIAGIAHSEGEAREIVLARLRALGADLPEA